MELIGLDNNTLDGHPIDSQRCVVKFHGRNASLVIGKNCKFYNCNIDIHDDGIFVLGDNSLLRGSFLIQKNCSIIIKRGMRCNGFLNISTAEKTTVNIGANCLVASAVIRSSDMHPIFDLDTKQRINKGADVNIGSNVWFAAESMVLKGSSIGNGSILAARALVYGSFGDNVLLGGIPAKVLRGNVTWEGRLDL